mmetsp:Transcript_88965/g.203483  ORF Transcript_88965/g.203483 Transcript_88965/m.203483 type:complete len:104 (+) Transcript_88965:1881-2192(+)
MSQILLLVLGGAVAATILEVQVGSRSQLFPCWYHRCMKLRFHQTVMKKTDVLCLCFWGRCSCGRTRRWQHALLCSNFVTLVVVGCTSPAGNRYCCCFGFGSEG